MNKLFTFLSVILAGTMAVSADNYPGGLPGLFSINAHGGQVRFAQGNLQYNAATGTTTHPDGTTSAGTWRFAPNQYDMIGVQNQNISSEYAGWIDLLGWATSGYDGTANDPCAINYVPYSVSAARTDCDETNPYGYGPSIDQPYRGLVASSAYYDWGVYNTISNSEENVTWRTLLCNEWYYLISGRPNAASLRSQATISNIHGYILLPDEWDMPAGITFVPAANNWTDNSYTLSQWAVMEQAGAVFLPAAGERTSNGGRYINSHGLYWTASAANSLQAQIIHFNDTSIYTNSRYRRYYGHTIRLVHDVNLQTDPLAKFSGFDARNAPLGDWIYNNGGFRNATNMTVEETDTVAHKYTLHLTTGGQESSFTLGGVRFSYTNSTSGKNSFKTSNWAIWPDGKGRKIIIPTYPGDEILVNVADSVNYLGLVAQGVNTSTVDLNAGDNILRATSDSIVITTSNATGAEVKVKIGAVLCLAHNGMTGIDHSNVETQTHKIIRNGQVLIQRGDKTYTTTGQEVK